MIIERESNAQLAEILQLSDLHIAIEAHRFDSHGEFRTHLRNSAAEFLENQLENGLIKTGLLESDLKKDFVDLLDLKKVPRLSFGAISFSHCPTHGVFVFSQKCKSIGVDIEDSLRVEKHIVARISSEKEVNESPSPGHLWSAKESSYKALYNFDQPNTASAVEIVDWKELSSGLWTFGFSCNNSKGLNHQGMGVCHSQDRLNLSISKI